MNISLKNRNLGVKETLAKNQRKIFTMERKNIEQEKKERSHDSGTTSYRQSFIPNRLRFRTLTSCVALLHQFKKDVFSHFYKAPLFRRLCYYFYVLNQCYFALYIYSHVLSCKILYTWCALRMRKSHFYLFNFQVLCVHIFMFNVLKQNKLCLKSH